MATMAGHATPPNEEAAARQEEGKEEADEHEADVEQREAYEYWGYLFKPDKTGTDKLKSLLRGLKDLMNEMYETSDNPDLTPNQLAHFYRDLHGNYDQLFLGTPSESIAFIYKSLGCLHSLQPLHHTHQTAFTDPTVPALKTEGWIMWQTIQVLLGPDEHSSFLREAVRKWDVKDHDTGEVFPKILPRECFPLEPDKHMVAWYEGVSERLRREAEEEERMKRIEVEHDDETPPRRLHERAHPPPRREDGNVTDEEGSVDSRGPALAYFRNPLYRHVDGRPSIVRRSSKRPALSPRPTMLDKGKEAASTFGRIARSVGSPHLWDGHSRSHSRDHPSSRRKSHPDSRYSPDEAASPAVAGAYPDRHPHPPREHSSHSHHSSQHRRRRSSQVDRPDRPVSGGFPDDADDEDTSQVYSPPSGSNSSRHRHHRPPADPRDSDRDQTLRHSRSHDPTPSQREGDDYFGAGYDDPGRRRTSVHERPNTPPPTHNGVGPSFAPSASPLFASTVAQHPGPPPPAFQQRPPAGPPPPGPQPYQGGPPLRNPSLRRARDEGRYPSRSPEPGIDPRDRRYGSPRPPPGRYDSPAPYEDVPPDHRPSYPSGPPMGSRHDGPPPRDPRDARYPPDAGPPPPMDPRDRPPPMDPRDRPPSDDPRDRPPSRDPRDRHRDPRDRRRSARMSGSEFEDYSGEDRRHGRPKQTRFADTGVSGRRYPDDSVSPWRRGSRGS
ncbi:hypothetical protein HII31_08137 [Pseudocercospora fuligena]|uniref:DUF7514 domain-containing protein n=1 Tax=Pseudocercospora fuligena TaxID=685502 RepID=A0A8H6VFJ0_9PEZI|nr:hypothetical protein HII31_08137 [Pseudocercospora fuligena]